MTEMMSVIKAVFDNGGRTADRYTVISVYKIHEDYLGTPNDYYLGLFMSENAGQPNGVCMTAQLHESYADMEDNPLGMEMDFEQLPENVQRAFWNWWETDIKDDYVAEEVECEDR